jgi:thioester reductase-like protein
MTSHEPKTGEAARSILFTGFPGFIGARLLPRILERKPAARVCCLVQEKFLALAGEAVREIEGGHPQARGRIELVPGDITVQGLGISARAAREMRRSLREAYHLAAVYDLAVRRDVGRRINVEGTKNVLEFLEAAPHFERLHHVSTAYVSGRARGTFRETDLDVGQGFKNHYEETKFQAEVEVARSRVPRTIYRPGIVVGDSRTGETAKFDGPYFVLSVMEQLPSPGVFPRIGVGFGTVNIVPADFVIEALAALSASPRSLGKTYHLCDPKPHSSGELADLFAEALGKRFVQVPVPLAVARAFFTPKPVQRFFGMPKEALDYFDDPVRHDTAQASHDLGELGVECPRLPDSVPRLVAFYRAHRDAVRREAMI